MSTIEDLFNADFATYEIALPTSEYVAKKSGKIVKDGWAIWFLFGSEAGSVFLDYYAANRFTNDRHVRIWDHGRRESLPTFKDFRNASDDPAIDRELEIDYYAHNQQVADILRAKGFNVIGDEPFSVIINRQLRLSPGKPKTNDA